MGSLAASFVPPAPRVLRLSDVLPTEELPSMGSAWHFDGTCKPCAFFHKQGCAHGTQCPFCHVCGPEEKKKRQKQKIATLRAARQGNPRKASWWICEEMSLHDLA